MTSSTIHPVLGNGPGAPGLVGVSRGENSFQVPDLWERLFSSTAPTSDDPTAPVVALNRLRMSTPLSLSPRPGGLLALQRLGSVPAAATSGTNSLWWKTLLCSSLTPSSDLKAPQPHHFLSRRALHSLSCPQNPNARRPLARPLSPSSSPLQLQLQLQLQSRPCTAVACTRNFRKSLSHVGLRPRHRRKAQPTVTTMVQQTRCHGGGHDHHHDNPYLTSSNKTMPVCGSHALAYTPTWEWR